MKVIIDTDPGQDDAMALMLMLKSEAVNVLAVTTVAGNSVIENTTRNAAYILNLLGKDNVPIYSGAEKPLKRSLVQAVVHGKSGLEGIDPDTATTLSGNAARRIIELVKDNPGQVTLLALGPLTNIAKAIEIDPAAMKQIKEIVIMGGAFNVPGNKNRVSEFNIYVDPEAAYIVTNFPVKKTFIPLDACNDVQLSLDDFRAVKVDVIRESLLAMNRPYIDNLKKDMKSEGALMYDVLAAYYLLEPRSCKTTYENIQIETEGKYTRGMTIIDQRPVKSDDSPNAYIVKEIPEVSFKELFINTLNS